MLAHKSVQLAGIVGQREPIGDAVTLYLDQSHALKVRAHCLQPWPDGRTRRVLGSQKQHVRTGATDEPGETASE